MLKQFWMQLFEVIFVLSTIVAVTDCCSSRILLLREHTLKIVQHNFHNHLHEHAHELQQQIEQHVAHLVAQLELNKTLSQELPEAFDTATAPPYLSSTTPGTMEAVEHSSTPSVLNHTDSVAPKPINTTSKFNKSDFYFTIMRDVLSLECSGQYLTDFCLNGGRCFRYPVANHSFFSCECADGYIGERCESKSLNELYMPTTAQDTPKPKVLMARIVFSFPMLMLLSATYILFGAFVVFRTPHAPGKQRTVGMFAS